MALPPPPTDHHVFSIDVEDWYHGIELPMDAWGQFESRVASSMGRLLDRMAKHGVTSTCFVLGVVAEECPDLVRRIHRAGHEVATHGYSHEKVYNLTPERFRTELRRSIDAIEHVTGEPVIGHRAPYFTITEDSLWALDILVDEGIKYDSSIHPVINYRYGIPDADRTAAYVETPEGQSILEVPVSTCPLPSINANLPCGGGAYLRIYPYWLQKLLLRILERRGESIGIYLHPWEVDPDHPRIDLPLRVSLTHYFNLTSTHRKVDRLFQDFSFSSYRTAYRDALKPSHS